MPKRFEAAVATDRFSIVSIYSQIFEEEYSGYVESLCKHFDPNTAKHILRSILRYSFFIEPVKQPKIESTKFSVRWSPSLQNDPRFCSHATCVLIFEKLLEEVTQACKTPAKKQLLKVIAKTTLLSYELNIDYVKRIRNGNIHTVENISFFWGDLPKQVFLLREYLLNSQNHTHHKFFTATYDKIIVKSFLTDRVLTGAHKTNREKRWEAHPNSVHFALRKECLQIEAKLIKQICHFQGFPAALRTLLTNDHVIEFSDAVTKCPITLDPISFTRFESEVLNPVHGKASFQVGHMHPLKSLAENEFMGHTADNISWVSSEGNRLQGELSVEETRRLVLRIIANYRSAGLI
ncbi:MAG: hypothetical protein K0S33_3722 [Bacteroidetes bacterium]|jgi:hypothetical protein|nr:hypothetical protein [Bacteroidota bacterium]